MNECCVAKANTIHTSSFVADHVLIVQLFILEKILKSLYGYASLQREIHTATHR